MKSLCRRIGKHHERVERANAGNEVGVVRAALLPTFLPFALDGSRIIAGRFLGRSRMDLFCHVNS
jgi:hypothetical protein